MPEKSLKQIRAEEEAARKRIEKKRADAEAKRHEDAEKEAKAAKKARQAVKGNHKVGDRIVDPAMVPAVRDFRDAWKMSGEVIDIDLAQAREIVRQRLREDRAERFKPFDRISLPLVRKAALSKEMTAEEKIALQAAEDGAQKLRDAPNDPRIDAAATPAALAALTLDVLVS